MPCLDREPSRLIAGYSYEWKRKLSDFATGKYELRYVFRALSPDSNAGTKKKEVKATADGPNTFSVKLSPSDTAGMEGGYQLVGYVIDTDTGGVETREVVFESTVKVTRDPLKGDGADGRTHARQMVDALKDTVLKLAKGTISSATVAGKTYTQKDIGVIRSELSRWRQEMEREEAADRISKGCGDPNRVFVRFTRPN